MSLKKKEPPRVFLGLPILKVERRFAFLFLYRTARNKEYKQTQNTCLILKWCFQGQISLPILFTFIVKFLFE